MAAAADLTRTDDGFVRLAASVPLRADADAVAATLERGVAGWEERPGLDGIRRYAVDLRLRLGGPGAALSTFRKAALVDIGAIRRGVDAHEVEIQWRAATAAPLFPVFSGVLHIGPDELSISGLYAPPGGAVGLIADRALLHVAATGTARWLLGEIQRHAREDRD
ncbi:MAG TPA: hypothetical protein VLA59_04025 [Patescibacteria group bacterium]|nr:hypothetical protein [Patescibacteria group bacterium]